MNKIPIFIATYNRHQITARSLESLANSNLPDYVEVIINDDGSDLYDLSITETICRNNNWALNKFDHLGIPAGTIERVHPMVKDLDIPYFIITDSDVLYSKNWLQALVKLYEELIEKEKIGIVTGFNTSQNYHMITRPRGHYGYKVTLGAVNMLVDMNFYKEFPTGWHGDAFDWDLCHYANNHRYGLVSTIPSVVEHFGGSTGVHGPADGRTVWGDVADDFKGEDFDGLSIFTQKKD